MLCYKDRTFCAESHRGCKNEKCYRLFTDQDKQNALDWWKGCKGDPPVAYSEFRDTDNCPGYKE